MVKAKVQTICKYGGHSITNNGSVNLTMKARYDELSQYIQLIQMLNNDVSIVVKHENDKAFKLGVFRIKEIKVDHDGEGILKFNSQSDFVEVDNLNLLVGEKDALFKVKYESEIEVEGDSEDESEI
jgi:hypothetical protein